MEKLAENTIYQFYNELPNKITPLGGGFYGRVFLAEIKSLPHKIVAKIYLYPNMAKKEALQLEILNKYSLAKIPTVYHVIEGNKRIKNDVLLMEYIEGVNAGSNDLVLTEENRINISNNIIDNLIAFHKIKNPNGFGEIGSNKYEMNWNIYYKEKSKQIICKAKKLNTNEKLDNNVYEIMDKAFKNYDKIFYLPIVDARLIHGDYNTWNIMLNKKLTNVKAIIDPYNCSWADSELDLYQLNNANGRYYGLFDLYKSKFALSENYEIKMIFYELYTEIMHYFDANIDIIKMDDLIQKANDLEYQMQIIGI